MENKNFEMKDIKAKKVKIESLPSNTEKNESSEQDNINEIFKFENSLNNLAVKFKTIFLIISFILIVISSYFLFKSYKPFLDKNPNLRYNKFVKEIGINVIISGFFFSFIPVFVMKNLIPQFYMIFISIYYFILFYFNNGNTPSVRRWNTASCPSICPNSPTKRNKPCLSK